jgi:ketosteroid isomerase-like protein
MKRIFAITVLLAAATALALGQTGDNQGQTKGKGNPTVEQVLMQMERDWMEANIKKDTGTLDRILADDWVAQTSDGPQTKAQALADSKSGDLKMDSWTLVEMKVRVFGDTAVVTGNHHEKSSYKGKDISGHYVWTDVFVKRQGRWQAVASQWSLMTKQ